MADPLAGDDMRDAARTKDEHTWRTGEKLPAKPLKSVADYHAACWKEQLEAALALAKQCELILCSASLHKAGVTIGGFTPTEDTPSPTAEHTVALIGFASAYLAARERSAGANSLRHLERLQEANARLPKPVQVEPLSCASAGVGGESGGSLLFPTPAGA